MVYFDLLLNLTLLVALSIVSAFIEKHWPRDTRWGVMLQGFLFGGAAIIGMLRPLNLGPGLIFDGRSVMVSLCGLFFGPLAAAVSGAMTILCRIILGGIGTLTGTLVILSSLGIGLIARWRFMPGDQPPTTAFLYLFGLAVHAAMLALMFTLPGGNGMIVVSRIGAPIMLLYPLATILAGKILSDQITALRTMAKLEESEALFRNLFEFHSAVKLLIDPENGAIIDANRAAENFYGWTKEQLRQMKVTEINTLPPEEVRKEIAKARHLQKIHFEFRHRRADGSVRDVEVFSSRTAVKGKELLHSIIHDISERKQAEEMLRTSERKYRNLFEHAPIGIFSTSSAGKEFAVNEEMAHILGFTSPQEARQNISGDGLWKQLFVDYGKQEMFLKELQKNGFIENYFCQGRTAEGRSIWLSMNARIAGSGEDGSVRIEGFATDVTEQRKLEDQFRQAQKMESVGRLAGGVAHDYNNMLSVIQGYAELALQKANPSEPLHGYIEEILKAAGRSADVTRQLLAYARRQTIEPRMLNLNDVLEGMLNMLKRLIGENIDLAWLPEENLWPVTIDPSQIDQLLANLSVNARDAIADIGKVTIETRNVTIDEAYCADHEGFIPGQYVMLAFSDDGCGMGKEEIAQIFEPFYTTKGIGRGTGLGLATVYGIVKQNGGFINVYAEPGKGTTFRIYLPRHAGEFVDSLIIEAGEPLHGNGECILVVEDDLTILALIKNMLEGLNYSVLLANTPREAIRLAGENAGKIHLLITDVIMPEMNGRVLSERLLTHYPDLRCLFMSGYTANVIAHRGVLDKGVNFIQKPISIRELALKVREALGKNEKQDP